MGALAWVRDANKRPAPDGGGGGGASGSGGGQPAGRTVVSGAPAVLPPPSKRPKKMVWKRDAAAAAQADGSTAAASGAAAGNGQPPATDQQQQQPAVDQQQAQDVKQPAAETAHDQQRQHGKHHGKHHAPHQQHGTRKPAVARAAAKPAAAAGSASGAAQAAELERLRLQIAAQEARLKSQTAAASAAKAAAASAAAEVARQKEARKAKLEAGFAAALAAAQKEAAAAAAAAGPAAAAADAAEVARVLAARDDYGVLQLAPGAPAAAIRRRYREMAVALHPDKCRQEQAKEAFQRLVRAYQNLAKYAHSAPVYVIVLSSVGKRVLGRLPCVERGQAVAQPARRAQEQPWEHLERLPADQLSGWRKFAEERQCSLDDSDYAPIFRDLAPFRAAGGVGEAAVEDLAAQLKEVTVATVDASADPPTVTFSKPGGPYGGFYNDLLTSLAPHLPRGMRVKLLMNAMDEPRSWTVALPEEVDELMRNNTLREDQVWHWKGCDAVGPEAQAMKRKHGMLASTLQFHARRGSFPMFSGFKVTGCFDDILIPTMHSNPSHINHAATHSGCPLSNVTFSSKRPVAFWRGSTTGATVHDLVPQEVWEQYHRQRLVALSQRHPEHLDAGFTAFVQCGTEKCEDMEKQYKRHPPMTQETAFDGFRYQMVVDGNSGAGRLLPTLCSGSLTMLASLVQEWYHFKLQPFKHYLPINLEYSDLVAAVEWARAHDSEARAIAEAAAQLVNRRLRRADAECYTMRLLYEYAAIYHPGNSGGKYKLIHKPPLNKHSGFSLW
ncbi:hypothetical protein C2E20_8489 [Micractinium conductrix]|uniref:J domain-containing protein n=1 Tax=Micractinium conductrix TaxID=554055 RepID=A0A2P6V175_9CHLO|nr:hypothetical protein C2E20_8489 [Micractinium conductrix]|eukprot:PSC67835.1 hypothetical protein C2E20_8489 [Micractinium conductrix]